jgi:hypothetical protein
MFLGTTCFGYGQNAYFQYKSERLDNDFSFPIFSNSYNSYSANKINQLLQIGELKVLSGFEENNLFEVISIDDGRIYGGKVGIDFTIYDNNSRVLSVKLNQASCGATCTYWVRYYNFNSGNGDLVQLKDLFTEKGFDEFFSYATKRRIKKLKKEIQRLKLPKNGLSEAISSSYKVDDLKDFYIKNNSLFLDGENSFLKNDKFYGIETVTKFGLPEFKTYLNSYGKSLFCLRKISPKKYRSNVLPQLFHGKIGNSKVILVLNTGYEDEMRAEYIYTKYGKGIYLVGKIDGDKITLTEKLPKPRESGFIDYVDNGTIEAKFDGKTMVGTWLSKDEKTTYSLRLERK